VKLLQFLILLNLLTPAFAQTDLHAFMTPRDLLASDSSSNISIQNNGASTTTIYGLYVRQYAYVTPGQTCASALPIYDASNNTTAGAVVMPITVNAGKGAAVGANYLYNMIYEAIYFENIIIPSSPPGCALPGCTWGSDSTMYNWCIYLGAIAPVTTTPGYTSNVVPSTSTASDVGYNYNAISNFVTIGPIACNDQNLTCTVTTQQTQPLS
jgi:hypothetical protein